MKEKNDKKQIFLIYGDEEYSKEQKKNEIIEAYGGKNGPDYTAFEGHDINYPEVRDFCITVPLLSEYRIIFINDSGAFKTEAGEKLLGISSDFPDTSCLIFYENEVDTKRKLYKEISKSGSVFKFDKVSGKKWRDAENDKSDIRRFFSELFRKENIRIDSGKLNTFLELADYDMMTASNEAEKLICLKMSEPGRPVSGDDILRICSRTLKDRIFELMDAKLEGRSDMALALFEDMISMKIAPMKVLYMLTRQFLQAYIVSDLLYRGSRDSVILEKTGMRDWQLKKLKNKAVCRNRKLLFSMFSLCVDMDTRIKKGDISDRLAVEMILCSNAF